MNCIFTRFLTYNLNLKLNQVPSSSSHDYCLRGNESPTPHNQSHDSVPMMEPFKPLDHSEGKVYADLDAVRDEEEQQHLHHIRHQHGNITCIMISQQALKG